MERDILRTLKSHLENDQITLLVGSRQIGKTTVLEQLASSLKKQKKETYMITLEDPEYLKQLNKHPLNLFELLPALNKKKKVYILIDEIQYLADPSNFLKLIYDLYKTQIKLIVTGSSNFYIDQKFKDSLAGRKRIFTMRTMSFKEMLRFRGFNQYVQYINQGVVPKIYKKEIDSLFNEYVIYGGYPRVVLANTIKEKKLYLEDLAESFIKKDAIEADLQKPNDYMKILSILSHQSGQLLNFTTIGKILNLSTPTVHRYIEVMEKSFHLSIVNTWSSNIVKELTKSPKVYFNDLGLLNYFRNDFEPLPINKDKGALLENYVFRMFLDCHNLKNIKYWRTQKKQEVDFVINFEGNTQKAYEVKYSNQSIKLKKYNYFKECYPNIPLSFIDYDAINELKIGEQNE